MLVNKRALQKKSVAAAARTRMILARACSFYERATAAAAACAIAGRFDGARARVICETRRNARTIKSDRHDCARSVGGGDR